MFAHIFAKWKKKRAFFSWRIYRANIFYKRKWHNPMYGGNSRM